MIIWLNGTFGAGKTTTAEHLVDALPDVRLFDPECVGYMVAEQLRDHEFTDFQQLQPWRSLVPTVMAEVTRFTGQSLIAPQTVLIAQYWQELHARFTEHSLDVFHVLLDVDPEVLRERIAGDQVERQAAGWRVDHLAEYVGARDWMIEAADLVVDTSSLSPAEVSATIRAAVTRWPLSPVAMSRPR